MAILKKNTDVKEWLRKHCENIQVVVRQRPQYHPPSFGNDDFYSRNYVASYSYDSEECYNVTLTKREVEYLAQIEDAMYESRHSYTSYNNPWGENRAEIWIKEQLAKESDEVALRKKYPTLQEAWDQYQFVKKMLGE